MGKYPDELIRGIANKGELNAEGNASSSMFIFRADENCSDGTIEEMSINWCDDKEKSIELAMNQTKKDGEIQFKAGVAILNRATLDLVKNTPVSKGRLAYKRDPLPDNEYHGNITLKTNIPKSIKDQIRSMLIVCVTSIVSRDLPPS